MRSRREGRRSTAIDSVLVMNQQIPLHVRCYSGHTYPQRPESFTIGEREHSVQDVLKTWREPGKLFFRVITEEGLAFTLEYDEAGDVWRLANGG